MEYRVLHISTMSADNLKYVNWFSKMKVYVEFSLGGDPGTNRRTSVDDGRGGNNHCWNDHFSFPIDAAALNNHYLVFKIKSKRALGDRDVGRVAVLLKELFDAAAADADAAERVVEYQVRRPSGEPRGTFRFSYKFSAPAETDGEPTAYPAHVGAHPLPPGVGMTMPYPHLAGHGYAPQAAYGHAPQPYGYEPPVVQAQQNMKRKNFGCLGAGPLGCLLVHGMFSDASDDAEV